MDKLLEKVLQELRPRFVEIVAITDKFCDDHLTDEYKELCRKMAVAVCQSRLPVTSGKVVSWAAGIVSALGWVNFLGDPSQKPHMRQEDIAKVVVQSMRRVERPEVTSVWHFSRRKENWRTDDAGRQPLGWGNT